MKMDHTALNCERALKETAYTQKLVEARKCDFEAAIILDEPKQLEAARQNAVAAYEAHLDAILKAVRCLRQLEERER